MPELNTLLEDEWKIWKTRQTSHCHLKAPVADIALTSTAIKLPLDTTNFHLKMLGGFTFDDANDRIYWDQVSAYGVSLPATFIGDAGLQVTAGISGSVKITLILKVDGVSILETPLNFTALNSIQGYGANGVLLDALDADLLQSGSYYEFWVKAGAGETPTITLDYFNVTIKRD